MKTRKLWIRKKKVKGKHASYVIEGRRGKKTILIWTISADLTRLIEHLIKTSFWTEEKLAKISKKLTCLEIAGIPEQNQT